MRRDIQFVSRLLVPGLAVAGSAFAQDGQDWSEPVPPFRVAGNWYYVGSKGQANYLVPLVESGGKSDFHQGKTPASLYGPAKVDHVLDDREEVKPAQGTSMD